MTGSAYALHQHVPELAEAEGLSKAQCDALDDWESSEHCALLNPFMDGDVVELECEGCGRLSINIQDDLKRTWARETRRSVSEAGGTGPTPQLTGKYAS